MSNSPPQKQNTTKELGHIVSMKKEYEKVIKEALREAGQLECDYQYFFWKLKNGVDEWKRADAIRMPKKGRYID